MNRSRNIFAWLIESRSICRGFVLAMGLVLILTPASEAQHDFREFLKRMTDGGDPILYSECSEAHGKSLLLITLKSETYDVWLFPVEEGWLLEGTHVLLKGNGFEFLYPPGGAYTKAKSRRYVEELLKGPFEFILPKEIEKLRFSIPKVKCPSFTPDDPSHSR